MKLTVSTRAPGHKGETNKLRRDGYIPAIIYSKGNEGESFALKSSEFNKHLNQITKGQLSTTVFTLVSEDGTEKKAIIKDIQYHVTTYNILHLDFEEIHDDIPFTVKVPIEFTGVADCVGIKLGGVLRTVIRFLKVKTLHKNMPKSFKLDVRNLKMKETKRLRDIELPEGILPQVRNMDEVVVVIAKR